MEVRFCLAGSLQAFDEEIDHVVVFGMDHDHDIVLAGSYKYV